jgi:acetyl-CoA carboxylase carboxyl transferase subunit alpha
MPHYLDFEKPIAELEGKIEELRRLTSDGGLNIADEVGKLQSKVDKQLRAAYGRLSAWQKVQVARHPERPHFIDYLDTLVTDFTPLAGDRLFGEDAALIGGIGRLSGYSCVVIGNEKGSETEDRVKRNFGMARPEGYRKAQRLMKLAERFHLPVVALVDTPGAYPGIDAEARGQAEAIARCLQVSMDIRVPMIAVIIGEGGSGGAIAIAAGNRVLMLEHAVYSVISPEGCASILWRSAEKAKDAAEALKLTAQDLLQLGVIDAIIPEPVGGAHRDRARTIQAVGEAIARNLRELAGQDGGVLRTRRREKFLEIGRQGLA